MENTEIKNYQILTAEEIAEKLADLAKAKKKLLIFCHTNPDGDTVGSAFALKGIYELLGGFARCVCPSTLPPYLEFLRRGQETTDYTVDMEENFDALWAVDVATPVQLGRLSHLAEKISVLIDHHGKGDPFCDYFLDPDACAAGELIESIYRIFIDKKMIQENPWICRQLYAAISSDSGSFRFSNTTPDTMRRGAALLETIRNAKDDGPDAAEIARRLHDCHTLADLNAQKLGIENLSFAAENSIAYICITTDLIQKSGLTDLDFGRIIDLPRSVEGTLVAFSIKQNTTDPQLYKISARSNCDIDVAAILATFGGGGHKRAAGGTIRAASADEVVKMLLNAATAPVEAYKSQMKSKEKENSDI